jgi:hypothetical protein
VEGDLPRLGAGYLVTIRLVAAATGDELASFQATRPSGIGSASGVGQSRDVSPAQDRRIVAGRAREPAPKMDHVIARGPEAVDAPSPPPNLTENMVRLRQAVALDSTFAYAWLLIATRCRVPVTELTHGTRRTR